MGRFGYKGRDFLLDGEKIVIRSGAIHYFRVHRDYWRDRLLKLKECGFNTVETYIAWNRLEKQPGRFEIDEDNDFGAFLDTAKELGLLAIVRPGPYICAEWNAGGFPAWIFADKNMRLRCSDEKYVGYVKNYLSKVFEVIRPRLLDNGGNVVAVQVENEYGSYGSDKRYMRELFEFCAAELPGCLLFVSDGPEKNMVDGGGTPGALHFLNFGSRVEQNMAFLAEECKDSPLFCSEFWCGWFNMWYGEPHTRESADVCMEVADFLKNDYSFNFYMFCGGTNFGFDNGAELFDGKYEAVTTSYDYFAPLNEAGDRTPTYYALKKLFSEHGISVPEATATETVKKAYGAIEFFEFAELFDNLGEIGEATESPMPLSFEEIGGADGYMVYSSVIPQGFHDQSLEIKGLKDRAVIFVDGKKAGVYERGRDFDLVTVDTVSGAKRLDILVENMGRINFGPDIFEQKGIEAVRIFPRNIMEWKNVLLDMTDLNKLKWKKAAGAADCADGAETAGAVKGADGAVKGAGAKLSDKPCFYKGRFFVGEVGDTFVEPVGFKKGFVVVNGFNVGRYYRDAGPQKRLYVPAPVLKKGYNEIVIFDSDGADFLGAETFEEPLVE